MRFIFASLLTLALAGPAHAQIDADFAMANRIFGQVSPAGVLENIEGEWLPLSTLSDLQGADPDPGLIESYLDRFCGNAPARGAVITAIDAASFAMAGPNSDGALVYRFDWLGGAQFYRSFDAEALFETFRLDTMEGERGIEMRARMLEGMTSHVDVYRISPDLLALATPKRVEIYGRCPDQK